MKRDDLRLVRICTQTVISVVLCEFTQCLFYGIFDFEEDRVMGCDALVVCVYEAPCSIYDSCRYSTEWVRERFTGAGNPSVDAICFALCTVPGRIFCLTAGSVSLYTVRCLVLCCRVSESEVRG